MRNVLVLGLVCIVVLSGCADPETIRENQRQARLNELNQYRATCTNDYGFERDTTEHRQCVQNLDQAAQAERQRRFQSAMTGMSNAVGNIAPKPMQPVIVNPAPVIGNPYQ